MDRTGVLNEIAAAIDGVLGDDVESLALEMGAGPLAPKMRAEAIRRAAEAVLSKIEGPGIGYLTGSPP